MTSEVVLMNRLAVALAADSAVSIDTGNGHKIFQSANKLFTLSKYQPIGIMIYNNSTFMDINWETIIKHYRDHLGNKKFDLLSQYAEDFLSWLDNNEFLFQFCSEEEHFEHYIKTVLSEKLRESNKKYFDNLISGEGKSEQEILLNILIKFRKEIEKENDLDCFQGNFKNYFSKKFDNIIQEVINRFFSEFKNIKSITDILNEISFLLVRKDYFHRFYSGLIFAGFGTEQIFPAMQSYVVGNPICGVVRRRKMYDEIISKDKSSVILPFAQSSMINTFVDGVDPGLKNKLGFQTIRLALGLPDAVIDAIDDLDDKQKAKWKEKSEQAVRDALDKYFEETQKYTVKNHTIPVHQAIRSLPIDELASSAEALVNLNSFQKRVSMDAETVGGPIDVAVISKGDGFIWIKRKHYFEPSLNDHFFSNYYGECVEVGGTRRSNEHTQKTEDTKGQKARKRRAGRSSKRGRGKDT